MISEGNIKEFVQAKLRLEHQIYIRDLYLNNNLSFTIKKIIYRNNYIYHP